MTAFGQLQRAENRAPAIRPISSHHESNKAFEGRNYKPGRKYGCAKIKQFTQGFALLFIKQRDYFTHRFAPPPDQQSRARALQWTTTALNSRS